LPYTTLFRSFAVGHHLDLDVTGPLDVELGEEVTRAEAPLGLGPGPLPRVGEGFASGNGTHATPTTAGCGLDHHAGRELLLGKGGGLRLGDADGSGGQDRHPGLLGGRPGAALVAEELQERGVRSDEGHPGPGTGAG